jgi:hypothetical protein
VIQDSDHLMMIFSGEAHVTIVGDGTPGTILTTHGAGTTVSVQIMAGVLTEALTILDGIPGTLLMYVFPVEIMFL